MGARDRLWAPWRHAFLLSTRQRRRCFFCAAKRSRADGRHHVLARGRAVFAILNRYPYNNGHLMIAPYRHVGELRSLRQPEWVELFQMARRLTKRLTDTLRPHAFNLGMNLGADAGAGVPGHLHLHIVPRWRGDTNFMPVLADTKVISQSLDEVYACLTGRAGVASR